MRAVSAVAISFFLLGCRGHGQGQGQAKEEAPAPPVASAPIMDAAAPPAPLLPDIETDWCLRDEGWRALDEGTCYLVPDEVRASPAPRLLIYLSGIVPPVARSPQKENVQRIVAAAAGRARVAAVLPRGRRGIGPSHAKDWWAWPTSAGDVATHASTLVAEWRAARSMLEAALGRPFAGAYLAGSSSGAYFLSALAVSGAFDADAYAAASGGAPGLAPARSDVPRRPFYVGYATGDPSNGGPKALATFLSSAGWPVRVVAHPGGHGAREVYLDEAFAFWADSSGDAGALERAARRR